MKKEAARLEDQRRRRNSARSTKTEVCELVKKEIERAKCIS